MRMLLIIICASTQTSVGGDYIRERKAAMELVAARQDQAALEKFSALAEAATSPVQQSDAFEQAAFCAQRLNQYELSLKLARRIPLAPHSKTCQMQLLEGDRQWAGLVEQFQSEPIEEWPESVRGPAYTSRGTAFLVMKNGPRAVEDFGNAVDFCTDANSRGYVLNQLGDACRRLLKDDDRALAAYRRAQAEGTVYKQCQAAISIAEILLTRNEAAAAVEVLDRIELAELMSPYWQGKLLCAQGQALQRAGRADQAKEKLTAALKIPGLPDEIRRECERLLKE